MIIVDDSYAWLKYSPEFIVFDFIVFKFRAFGVANLLKIGEESSGKNR